MGHKIFKFGAFQFDTRQQELSQNGLPVRLSASQIRLLTLFLEHPRELVSREEITRRLWNEPSTIDVTSGINTAVNRLRSYLNDDSVTPAYIETVVGLGYRFIAPVSEEKIADSEKTLASLTNLPLTVQRSRWPAPAIGVMVLLITVGATVWRHYSHAKVQTKLSDPLVLKLVTLNDDGNKVTSNSMSPDGRMIAYADNTGVLVHTEGLDLEQSVATPSGLEVHRVDWYADMQRLAVSGSDRLHHEQVWTLSLKGEAPKLLLDDADMAALSPAGTLIAFLRKDGRELWCSDIDGAHQRLLQSRSTSEIFRFALWSPNSKWLIAQRWQLGTPPNPLQPTPTWSGDEMDKTKQWVTELLDPANGQQVDAVNDERFDEASITKDGKLLYAEVPHGLHENSRLMAQSIDLSRGRFTGTPQLLANFDISNVYGLSSSLDGKRFTVLETRAAEIVLVGRLHYPGPELEDVVQITHRSVGSFPHAWTSKSDGVLLENNNNPSGLAIYEEAVDGSKLTPIARLPSDAAMAQVTPDGAWILFLGFRNIGGRPYGVFRVPSTGGVPQQLDIPGDFREISCPISAGSSCVIREILGTTAIVFYTIDPLKGLGKELGRIPWQQTVFGEWSISPDGRTVATPSHDPGDSGIELVDFSQPAATISKIPVTGFGSALDATWAPDGKGLYVESQTEDGYDLLYQPLVGRTILLRKSVAPVWGVPSRDGTKLAFPEPRSTTNLWTGSLQP